MLLQKLIEINICGNVLTWLKAFLCDRFFRAVVNNSFSAWSLCSSGVPQGSVLGPILFLIFTLQINSVIKLSTSNYFADDTKLPKIINNYRRLLISTKRFVNWFLEHGLRIIAKKCLFLRIKTTAGAAYLPTTTST